VGLFKSDFSRLKSYFSEYMEGKTPWSSDHIHVRFLQILRINCENQMFLGIFGISCSFCFVLFHTCLMTLLSGWCGGSYVDPCQELGRTC